MFVWFVRFDQQQPTCRARSSSLATRNNATGFGTGLCLLRTCACERMIQGRFEIADICLASAFSKARFGLRKPRFFLCVL